MSQERGTSPMQGLALAALADNEHHLLSLGAGDQAVANAPLQGGDVGIDPSARAERSICQRSGLAALGSLPPQAGGSGRAGGSLLKGPSGRWYTPFLEVDAVLLDGERVGKGASSLMVSECW